jgi:hypothetical protein
VCALFVPLSKPVGPLSDGSSSSGEQWSIDRAEDLLGSLTGVVSVRVVAGPDGTVDEVHLLTTDEIGPKQTVRNVESALLAHYRLKIDHRKISVAQQASPKVESVAKVRAPQAEVGEPTLVASLPTTALERRILFTGHQVASERSQHVRMQVNVEWNGLRYSGAAESADLPRPRMEAVANAALRAVESAVVPEIVQRRGSAFNLSLDGVKRFEAFEKDYVLVSVHALSGSDITPLSGTASVSESPDRAVILATLQATDRWVRGRI